MKATRAPAAAGAMLYHSMLIHVSTCPTSFHQLYSMMKLAMVLVERRMSANSTASRIRLRICEGRIKQDFRFGPEFPISTLSLHETIGQPPSRVKLRSPLLSKLVRNVPFLTSL